MKYKVILADPAWKYSDTRHNDPAYAGITYDVMSTEQICNLPVKDIADKDCALLLWTTMPMLPEALKVMKSWGFKFKTCAFSWVKLNKKSKTYATMLGQWTMGNVELCLLGTKGHPKRISKNVKQLVVAVRDKHSKKPEEVRSRIYELFGDVPRIELFARQSAEGWAVLGNEIDGKDLFESIKEEAERCPTSNP